MPRKMFLKDMLYLLFTFLVLLAFSLMGELNAIMCGIMVAMYIGYISLVIVLELRKKWKAQEKGIRIIIKIFKQINRIIQSKELNFKKLDHTLLQKKVLL
jgi:Ca2+/Na+ antiporter